MTVLPKSLRAVRLSPDRYKRTLRVLRVMQQLHADDRERPAFTANDIVTKDVDLFASLSFAEELTHGRANQSMSVLCRMGLAVYTVGDATRPMTYSLTEAGRKFDVDAAAATIST